MLEKRKEKTTISKIAGLNYRIAIGAQLENLKDQVRERLDGT